MLIAATISTLTPNLAASSFPLLTIGMVLALVGLSYGNRWVRPPLSHTVLENALKGIGKDTVLLNYWPVAKHILITKNGIYTFAVRTQPFDLTINENRWQDHEPLLRRLHRIITQNALGSPLDEVERSRRRIEQLLKKQSVQIEVPITPLIVFANSKTKLEVLEQPPIPVVYADKRTPALKTFLKQPADTTLSASQIAELQELFQSS